MFYRWQKDLCENGAEVLQGNRRPAKEKLPPNNPSSAARLRPSAGSAPAAIASAQLFRDVVF